MIHDKKINISYKRYLVYFCMLAFITVTPTISRGGDDHPCKGLTGEEFNKCLHLLQHQLKTPAREAEERARVAKAELEIKKAEQELKNISANGGSTFGDALKRESGLNSLLNQATQGKQPYKHDDLNPVSEIQNCKGKDHIYCAAEESYAAQGNQQEQLAAMAILGQGLQANKNMNPLAAATAAGSIQLMGSLGAWQAWNSNGNQINEYTQKAAKNVELAGKNRDDITDERGRYGATWFDEKAKREKIALEAIMTEQNPARAGEAIKLKQELLADEKEASRHRFVANGQDQWAGKYRQQAGALGKKQRWKFTEALLGTVSGLGNMATAFILRDKGKNNRNAGQDGFGQREPRGFPPAGRDRGGNNSLSSFGPSNNDKEEKEEPFTAGNTTPAANDLFGDGGGGGGGFPLDPGRGIGGGKDAAKEGEPAKFLGRDTGDAAYGGDAGGGFAGGAGDGGFGGFEDMLNRMLANQDPSQQYASLAGSDVEEADLVKDIIDKENASLFAVVHKFYLTQQKNLMRMAAKLDDVFGRIQGTDTKGVSPRPGTGQKESATPGQGLTPKVSVPRRPAAEEKKKLKFKGQTPTASVPVQEEKKK